MPIKRKASVESHEVRPYDPCVVGHHHLIGIAFSHYVEKARWVLQRYSVPYTEDRYLPFMHMPRAVWESRFRGASDRVSSPFSTPILITDRQERICDSAAIVRYASDRFDGQLYEDPAAQQWETRFHDVLAPATRRVGYSLCLGDKDRMAALLSNVGTTQRALFRVVQPVAGSMLRRYLSIHDDAVEQDIETTFAELDAVGETIADGRKYLLGDTFSAADIAFATAISPALCVQPHEGMDAKYPEPSQMTGRAGEVVKRARASAAGQFALRLFAEER